VTVTKSNTKPFYESGLSLGKLDAVSSGSVVGGDGRQATGKEGVGGVTLVGGGEGEEMDAGELKVAVSEQGNKVLYACFVIAVIFFFM
jgi:hypothetical protein